MATTQWIGGSGSWNDPANWSNGVPGPADDAIINVGSQSDTISGGGTVGTLTVDGYIIYGALLSTGSLTIEGTIAAGTFSNSDDSFTITPGAELFVAGTGSSDGDEISILGTLEESDYYGANLDTSYVNLTGPSALWVTRGTIASGVITATDSAQIDASELLLGTRIDLGAGVIVNSPIDGLGGPERSSIGAYADTTGTAPSVINGAISGSSSVYLEVGRTLVIDGPASGLSPLGYGLLVINGTYTGGAEIGLTQFLGGSTLELNGPVIPDGEPFDFLVHGELIFGPQATVEGGPVLINSVAGDTIFAAAAPVLAEGSSKPLGSITLINGTIASTVLGGAGGVTVFGGVGGGVFFGGVNGFNVLVGESGRATIVGGGSGDQLWAGGAAGDVIAAASGNETLGAGNSTGNNVFFGGSGSDVILAGAGNDVVIAGPGTPTIVGGATGNTAIFAGSGADLLVLGGGADYAQFGAGNATAVAGAGGDVFAVYSGQAGGSEVISGFKNGTDQIALRGYASMPNIVAQGGNTTITLADNTHITLLGVSSLAPNSFL